MTFDSAVVVPVETEVAELSALIRYAITVLLLYATNTSGFCVSAAHCVVTAMAANGEPGAGVTPLVALINVASWLPPARTMAGPTGVGFEEEPPSPQDVNRRARPAMHVARNDLIWFHLDVPFRCAAQSCGARFSTLFHSMLFIEEQCDAAVLLRFDSSDRTNRLTLHAVLTLTDTIQRIALTRPSALIITGNEHFFSAGADLNEITALTGPAAYEFSLAGQRLMNTVAGLAFAAIAAVHGYCMGGGLDLALACHKRIAAPNAVFGHRGAALGLITGWGGTQRLPRIVGKARALEMFLAAEKVHAEQALRFGLISQIADDPVRAVLEHLKTGCAAEPLSMKD
jgi:enoyl-CoA hydratase